MDARHVPAVLLASSSNLCGTTISAVCWNECESLGHFTQHLLERNIGMI